MTIHKYMKETYEHFRRSLAMRVNGWWSQADISLFIGPVRSEAWRRDPGGWLALHPEMSAVPQRTGRGRQGKA